MPIGYTEAPAWCAAFTACRSDVLLETSRPSVSAMITWPGWLSAASLREASATASQSAVPEVLSGLRSRKAASASAVELENRVRASAWWPNAITSMRSAAPLAATNVRAAAMASRSGRPLIDCELSISRTTLFARPRL